MSEEFYLDPNMELPLEALLTKPVQLMDDAELMKYRQELALLRRPQTLTAKINGESQRVTKKASVAKATTLANKYC